MGVSRVSFSAEQVPHYVFGHNRELMNVIRTKYMLNCWYCIHQLSNSLEMCHMSSCVQQHILQHIACMPEGSHVHSTLLPLTPCKAFDSFQQSASQAGALVLWQHTQQADGHHCDFRWQWLTMQHCCWRSSMATRLYGIIGTKGLIFLHTRQNTCGADLCTWDPT